MIGNLGKKAMLNFAVSLAKDILPKLATKATSSVINNCEKKKKKMRASGTGVGAVRAGKIFTLFILFVCMDNIIRIIKSLENLDVLIDGVTETVKHEIKK